MDAFVEINNVDYGQVRLKEPQIRIRLSDELVEHRFQGLTGVLGGRVDDDLLLVTETLNGRPLVQDLWGHRHVDVIPGAGLTQARFDCFSVNPEITILLRPRRAGPASRQVPRRVTASPR